MTFSLTQLHPTKLPPARRNSSINLHRKTNSLASARGRLSQISQQVTEALKTARPMQLRHNLKLAETHAAGYVGRHHFRNDRLQKQANKLVHQRRQKQRIVQELTDQLKSLKLIAEGPEQKCSLVARIEDAEAKYRTEVEYTKTLNYMLLKRSKELTVYSAPLKALRTEIASLNIKLADLQLQRRKLDSSFEKFSATVAEEVSNRKTARAAAFQKLQEQLKEYKSLEYLVQYKAKLQAAKALREKIKANVQLTQEVIDERDTFLVNIETEREKQVYLTQLQQFYDKLEEIKQQTPTIHCFEDILEQHHYLQNTTETLLAKKQAVEESIVQAQTTLRALEQVRLQITPETSPHRSFLEERLHRARSTFSKYTDRNQQSVQMLSCIASFTHSLLRKAQITEEPPSSLLAALQLLQQRLGQLST